MRQLQETEGVKTTAAMMMAMMGVTRMRMMGTTGTTGTGMTDPHMPQSF